jgi:hypothetical protein
MVFTLCTVPNKKMMRMHLSIITAQSTQSRHTQAQARDAKGAAAAHHRADVGGYDRPEGVQVQGLIAVRAG